MSRRAPNSLGDRLTDDERDILAAVMEYVNAVSTGRSSSDDAVEALMKRLPEKEKAALNLARFARDAGMMRPVPLPDPIDVAKSVIVDDIGGAVGCVAGEVKGAIKWLLN